MTRTIDPVASQLPQIFASLPPDTPLVMLNLLRFRDVATYRDGENRGSGREAYARYGEVALRAVQSVGGEAVYQGSARAGIICPEDELWHEVLLVRYPSVQAFQTMLAIPEYREATRHRTAALEDARLIATVERR